MMSIEVISTLVLFVSFFVLLMLKVPVSYSIGISTTLSLLLNIDKMPGLTTIAQHMSTGIDSFALLAIPFFVLGVALMAYIAFVAITRKFAKGERVPLSLIWTYFRKAFFNLILLVIVVRDIVSGIFTAAEASAVAVLYAGILALIYGDINLKDFPAILLTSAKTTAIIMFLVCTSIAMSWLFSFEGIPELISKFLIE